MESGMISVDKWSHGSQAYFLTHLHADHTAGLSSTWKCAPLFCSPLSARIFLCKFPGFDLSLINVLDIGVCHSLSLILPSSGEHTTVYVTPVDAHHCPGSVMYLFRGDFGCVLYTGDFRWQGTGEGCELTKSLLLDALKNEKLNIMYLDNTYCNPIYVFPSRENATKKIIEIIVSHPNHQVIIGIDSLGKEDLLLEISRELNMKIWVWPERLQIMHLLGFHSNFTTKTSLTRVRAVPRYSFSVETLEALNEFSPTIGIMPSGLPWLNRSSAKHDLTGEFGNYVERHHEYMYTVPYSDHSCFAEIQDFVELLRPIHIKGIVSSSSCRIDPVYYLGHLCGDKQSFCRIQQNLENEDCHEPAIKSSVESGSTLAGRKRRISQVDSFRVRFSRVSLLRRLNRGVRITDDE